MGSTSLQLRIMLQPFAKARRQQTSAQVASHMVSTREIYSLDSNRSAQALGLPQSPQGGLKELWESRRGGCKEEGGKKKETGQEWPGS